MDVSSMEQFSIGGSIVFDGALPRQKHPKLSGAKPRADQTRRLPQAACDKREYDACETSFACKKTRAVPDSARQSKQKSLIFRLTAGFGTLLPK